MARLSTPLFNPFVENLKSLPYKANGYVRPNLEKIPPPDNRIWFK